MDNRNRRAEMAQETLTILKAGRYPAPSGKMVSIGEDLEKAIQGTRLYRPSDFPDGLVFPPRFESQAAIEVTAESTLEAAHRLVWENPDRDPLCLNFASAKNPGGGFLSGSQAQEESLARSSGLYPCLLQQEAMYTHNRRLKTCLYSDHMIYAPRVPVFRDHAGVLLERPYCASFLSVPAVNAGAVRRNEPKNVARIESVMRERMAKLLWVAREHGHDALILGAWGCGVFGNDPALVARLFMELLAPGGPYAQQFRHVVFAIYDRTAGQTALSAFRTKIPKAGG
ncbi:MAG TPA: TIGR02452 family protein [Chthonomonadaceae bacterium]|nr:TIGR02452 family protein [Chthonomonadaceae bacterium]